MVLFCDISIVDLQLQGKDYVWLRPCCPRCKSKIWGHGFVRRFFNGIKDALFIKRWRCPTCFLVLTSRPKNYWRRYQESIENIFNCLKYRASNLTWPPWCSRQRGGHWMNKLIIKAKIRLMLKESLLAVIMSFEKNNYSIN